jgi:hypothetical protein
VPDSLPCSDVMISDDDNVNISSVSSLQVCSFSGTKKNNVDTDEMLTLSSSEIITSHGIGENQGPPASAHI